MGSINLLTAQVQPQGRWDRIYGWTVNTAKYIIVGTELLVLMAIGFRFYLDGKINDIDKDIQDQKDILKNRSDEETSVRYVAGSLTSLSRLEKTDYTLTPYYKRILEIVPSGVVLQNISVTINGVDLSGNVSSYETLRQLENSISNATFIVPGSSNFTSNQQQSGGATFTVSFKIKFQENGN